MPVAHASQAHNEVRDLWHKAETCAGMTNNMGALSAVYSIA